MSTSQSESPPAVVVGTGFGCRIHVPALRAAGFSVVALVGTDEARTQRRAATVAIPQAFTDLDEALRATGAVAVTIATPPYTHAALTLTALKHGCHVICEKPMAADTAEAAAMRDAAARAGVMHLMGNEFRWTPETALIGRALTAGMIGKPRFVTLSSYMPLIAAPDAKMPSWWFDEGAGGGWLGAHGSHLVDQVHWWLGDFASLSATLTTVADRPGEAAEDSYLVRFRLVNGAQGVLQHTAGAWGAPSSTNRIAGTAGTIWSANGVVSLADRDGTRELPFTDDLTLPEAAAAAADSNARHVKTTELRPFIRLCEMLLAGVEKRTPRSAVPLPTFDDGVKCMRVLDAIRESAARDGTLVTL